jgi:glyoxylase-like metal-dependent hydrolase (beta-lactamase superfamily II)/ferredoxin
MADYRKHVPENVPGDFFVDSTCIDCDACRQIAPSVFGETDEYSFVRAQPMSVEARRDAVHALLACPTGSIGTLGPDDPKKAAGDFPLPIEMPVYYCGYNSPKSYGGNSYFLTRTSGNWLVDSPKFVAPLVRRLEELGGITHIFLTHSDDVADAAKFAKYFGARRFIHKEELSSQPDAEVVLNENRPHEIGPGIFAIPTPGHTRGHCVLLLDEKFLFTGDHLAWSRERNRLAAHRDYCWHSWSQQTDSMERLADYRFEWVLPGHGQRVHLPADEMQQQMRGLVERMRKLKA